MQPPEEMRSPGQMRSAADLPAEDVVVLDAEDVVVLDEETPVRRAGVAPRVTGTDRRWSEILAMFVDDPRGSVKQAADLIDQAVEDLVGSVRQRQATLASAWQDSDGGTERLRGLLIDYRAFWAVVRDMPAADATSPRPDTTGPRTDATSPRPDTTGPRTGATSPRPGTYPDADGTADLYEPGRGRTPA